MSHSNHILRILGMPSPTGNALEYLRLNGTEDALEYATVPTVSPSALTRVDDTNVTLTLGGSPNTSLLAATSLTLGWTGQLAVTRGGTGLSTVTQGDIIYASAADTFSALAKSVTPNQYLKNSGTSNNPAWATISASDIGSGAALTKVDDTNVTLTLGGSPSTSLLAAASLTLGWTGQLSLARGGTGANLVDPNADRILFWDDSAGATTWLDVASPITITTTTLGFDQTVALDNNARIAVSKNSGATVGTRRRINFIEGTNITLTISDDSGNEEVDVTITAASGSSGLTVGTTTITSGTNGRILYNNSGILGEKATTGSGNVVLDTSPTITTPVLATSFTLNDGTTKWSMTTNFYGVDIASKYVRFGSSGNNYLVISTNDESSTNPATTVNTIVAGKPGLMVQLAGSQTADALQVYNSAASKIYSVTKDGYITAQAPAYSSGGYDVLVRNQGTGRFETASISGSGITRTIVNTSGSITMGSTASVDYIYFVTGAHTLSLPAASGNTNRYTVKNNHSSAITVDTLGAENVEGASSISVPAGSSVDLASDGTNWWIL